MGLKLINDTLKLKEFEKELSELFSNKFNNTKLVSYKNIEGEKNFFSLKYSLNSSLWFDYQKNLSSVKYLIGDLNCPTKYPNINMRCNFIKPHISININLNNPESGNCRFAIESENNEKYLLLETSTKNDKINSLKLLGLKNITVRNSVKKYFKIEFNKIIEYLEAFVKNIEFYPINFPLNIKSYDKINLKKDLIKIQNNIPIIQSKDSEDNIVKIEDENSEKFNKTNTLNMLKCEVCQNILSRNKFKKLSSGENFKICKNCEENILAIKFLKTILKYVKPGEKFNKKELIIKHSYTDLNKVINILYEKKLIKKDSELIYQLKSEDILIFFLNKFMKSSPQINEKYNHFKRI